MQSWMWALAGGGLLGLGGAVLWLGLGRTIGISGIAGGLLRGRPDRDWRLSFLAGLAASGAVLALLRPAAFGAAGAATWPAWPVLVAAGLLVGAGTRLGNGCTSGHGVCGISRFSKRSLASTVLFVGLAMVTVTVVRALGGAS